MATFKDMNLSYGIQKSIGEMGFKTPTPIQETAIPEIMQKHDIIAQAQTGTGKTLAFAIPMLEMLEQDDTLVQGLVLCPTREIARQTADQIKLLAKHNMWVKVLPVYGGQAIERQYAGLKKKPQIVIGTPGRLMDHMEHNRLKLHGIKMLVLDEADEMLSMGFQDDIDAIIKKMPKLKQTLMFSATISKDILRLATKYQVNPQQIKMPAQQLTVSAIEQFSFETHEGGKFGLLTRIVDTYGLKRSLVFSNTKRKATELTKNLRMRGYVAEAIHSDISQNERNKVLSRFKDGNTTLLIATDVAARGIDVQDIDAVINYDVPNDIEYYVHRIGRTGRAGKSGASYTFATARDSARLRDIQRYTNAKIMLIEPPTEINMENKIMSELINKATRALQKRKYTDYITDVQKILDEANSSGEGQEAFTATDLSAALLQIITTQPAGRIKPETKPQRTYNKPKKNYGSQGKSYGGQSKPYDKQEKSADSEERTYGKQGSSSGYKGKSSGYKGKTSGYQGKSSGYQGKSSDSQGNASGYKGKSSGYQGNSSDTQGNSTGYKGKSSGYKGSSSGSQGKSYKPKSSSGGGYNKSGRSKQSPTSANQKKGW